MAEAALDDLSLERLIYNLNTLAELGEEISSQKDFGRAIKSSLLMVMGSFSASRGLILQHDEDRKVFRAAASKGIADANGLAVRLDDGVIAALVGHNKPIVMKNGGQPVLLLGQARAALERLGAEAVAPLVVKDELMGLIAVNGKLTGEPYNSYDMRILSVMAKHIAFSLQSHALIVRLMHKYTENKMLLNNLRRIYYDTIHAFAAAIDAKDAYTKGHSHRVSAYSAAVARELKWSEDEVEGIRVGGLLHDVGKIAVDKSIINKAAPLTSVECRELNAHPVVGYEILSKIKFPWKGLPLMTRNHHEKVDGSGYPDRLKGNEIPMGARLMALVDAFDAMTTDRPYRPRLPFKEAMEELRVHFGRQFDADCVHGFLSVLTKELAGECESPTITPLLQEHLDGAEAARIFKAFPARRT